MALVLRIPLPQTGPCSQTGSCSHCLSGGISVSAFKSFPSSLSFSLQQGQPHKEQLWYCLLLLKLFADSLSPSPRNCHSLSQRSYLPSPLPSHVPSNPPTTALCIYMLCPTSRKSLNRTARKTGCSVAYNVSRYLEPCASGLLCFKILQGLRHIVSVIKSFLF